MCSILDLKSEPELFQTSVSGFSARVVTLLSIFWTHSSRMYGHQQVGDFLPLFSSEPSHFPAWTDTFSSSSSSSTNAHDGWVTGVRCRADKSPALPTAGASAALARGRPSGRHPRAVIGRARGIAGREARALSACRYCCSVSPARAHRRAARIHPLAL